MEAAPKQEKKELPSSEQVGELGAENIFESIERAKKLFSELKAFENTDIVGREALNQVESLAHSLGIELKNVPAGYRLENELPLKHPHDEIYSDNQVSAQAA